jgi:hypothetical protein
MQGLGGVVVGAGADGGICAWHWNDGRGRWQCSVEEEEDDEVVGYWQQQQQQQADWMGVEDAAAQCRVRTDWAREREWEGGHRSWLRRGRRLLAPWPARGHGRV